METDSLDHEAALADLISIWQHHRAQGNAASPAELCRERPELLAELERRIAALERISALNDPFETVDDPTRETNPPIPAQSKPRVIGRFDIKRVLGQGGFGMVYLARDTLLQRLVAIKVPHRHLVSHGLDAEIYLIEARTVASLDHPNIVPVYELGSDEEHPILIVSKYIEGKTLAEQIKGIRPSPTETVELTAVVAETLHYAHCKGLVHRDIKPGNILLDKSGKPFVTDFGLALREQDVGGQGPCFAGTLAYMSPEQAKGEGHRVDGRSDIFSLGIVFYELLTGRRPFHADSAEEVREQIIYREVRPPRQWDDTIPKELERICLKALSKRSSERYPTAKDLADDLRHFLAQPAQEKTLLTPSLIGADALHAAAATPSGAVPSELQGVAVVPRGLRSFDATDASFFVSLLPGPRDRDGLPESLRFWKTRIEETDAEQTFAVGLLYGPSGCGKSSLLKAGLLPRLAPAVTPIYIEATARETEIRILKGLRKHCPGLPADAGLAASVAALRRGTGIGPGAKVLLVLDQFEQWLHATRGRQDLELPQALRQCDGRRIQCVILVRDDYWMTTTRFMRELEVPLAEGKNSLAVDLFDLRHARKVLTSFGRSYGALPEGALSAEHKQFLDRAIIQLSQEGKVVPVRLSLFAEMVKGKPWTPATLRGSGGAEGLGVRFLEDTFSSSTAPPEHRLHQAAARAVLKELLPEPGANIRGRMQPYSRLLAVSGYARSPQDFDDLLSILDTQLRLLTPADREGSTETDSSGTPIEPDERYYQLTHDYLVPALREWLTAKQRETRHGRAELRLADQAALWAIHPEKRYLPSAWEWADILLLGRRLPWTGPERRMMAAATRYHAFHALLAVAGVLFVLMAGLSIYAWIEERQQTERAEGLIARLLVADLGQVPRIIEALEEYRSHIDAELTRIAEDPHRPRNERLRASLALVSVDAAQVPYLFDRLLAAEPEELHVIRHHLRPYADELIGPLWQAFQETSDSGRKLRAACALAAYDSEDERWSEIGGPVVGQLVKEDPLLIRSWSEALRPASKHLLDGLGTVYRRHKGDAAERNLATSILADYTADDPAFLIELIKDADPRQYAQLIGKLDAYRTAALAGMSEELAETTPPGAADEIKDRLAGRQANAAVTLFRMGQHEAVWPPLRYAPDPRLRNNLIHALSQLGAEPFPLAERWGVEQDVSVRRMLLLALAEFPGNRLSGDIRDRLISEALDAFREAADPGLRSAAEWLLRSWGAGNRLVETDQKLQGRPAEGSRTWHVDGQGHTMVGLDSRGRPVPIAGAEEGGFAMATKEVTIEQFLRFRRDYFHLAPPGSEGEYPVNVVSWFDAVAYCRWLSEQEGIAEEQMCYPPLDQIKGGMRLPADYLRRTGYRLPTEEEWEQACRAGTTTSRFYGEADDLLPKYAWFQENSEGRPQRVGQLKPNDLGMFDMLGNTMEWCQGTADGQADRAGDAIQNDTPRTARGGGIHHRAEGIRCTHRDPFPASTRWHSIGFRVARTIRPGS